MARILVVDDEEYMRDFIKELLLPEKHELHFAADGSQVFELLRKNRVDLIIVDRTMPGMSGIEVVRMIRMNSKTAALKVLMCTSSSMTKEIDEAFAAGADDYVLKPMIMAQLAVKVAKMLTAPPGAP